MKRWVVILAGGVGSRFWPLSTPTRPKQLLPLIDQEPLLRNTIGRLLPLADADRILVLTNASLVEPIHQLVPEIPRANLVAEPKPAGTAAALAWAAELIARRDGDDAVMLSVHADWAIGDAEGFRQALLRAAALVAAQRDDVRFRIVGAALFAEQAFADDVAALVGTLGLAGRVELAGFTDDPAAAMDAG